MKTNTLKNKSYAFALRVVKLSRYLTVDVREYVLSKQVLRSGTSIGAKWRKRFKRNRSLTSFTSSLSRIKKPSKHIIGLDF